MGDVSELTNDELNREQYRRIREKLGYPLLSPVTDAEKLKWITLRRDRLQRELDAYLVEDQKWRDKGESVPNEIFRAYQATLLSMSHYMLEDVNCLLTLLKLQEPSS